MRKSFFCPLFWFNANTHLRNIPRYIEQTMKDDKNKVTDKAGEIAKNIWLAGVGAYGRAVDEAQDRLGKVGGQPPKLFRDLVKAGAALEEEAREALQAGQTARDSVEERIGRVRENFNLQRPARGEDLLALHEKIDRLSNKVEALTRAMADQGAVKPARKKAAKKKAPAKKAATRKTAAPKKGAAKKAPAKRKASTARARKG